MSGKESKIAIWGSGGTSKEIAFLIEDINKHNNSKQFKILGFIEKDDRKKNIEISGYRILGTYDVLNEVDCDGFVIPIGSPWIKMKILNEEISRIKKNLVAYNLIHPSVILRNEYIDFGIGNIICAGTVLTTDIKFGNFNLINRNCTIGHDVIIGDFNVINPITSISGGVKMGNNNLIGTGVKILQNLEIGNDITIGAGAVVTKNILDSGTYIGMPAKKKQ